MKEKPIIFSTEMVRAILDGRKTQDRRVIKPQPEKDECWYLGKSQYQYTAKEFVVSPYAKYKVGDRLWVRETWAKDNDDRIYYKEQDWDCKKWKSPVTMPRWASRITLVIIDIRVERIRDISTEDATAEGISPELAVRLLSGTNYLPYCIIVGGMKMFWNSTHKKQYSWESNPFVWVITFGSCERP